MTSTPSDRASTVSIRIATAADQGLVESLVARYREELGRSHRGASFPSLSDGRLAVILAEVGGETVGMIAAQRCYAFAGGEEYLLLSDMYVVPEQRRRKAASALMQGVKAHAERLGVHGMRLFVQDINLGALTTAARSGFTRSKELVLCYGDGAPDEELA